jgi:hypothetical protein
MSFEDVMHHYGFEPIVPVVQYPLLTEWEHPTARDQRDRACSVMILGSRAIVHCSYGSPIYSVTPNDVEFLLRQEFSCFASMLSLAPMSVA